LLRSSNPARIAGSLAPWRRIAQASLNSVSFRRPSGIAPPAGGAAPLLRRTSARASSTSQSGADAIGAAPSGSCQV
jgi:hypothetical protein